MSKNTASNPKPTLHLKQHKSGKIATARIDGKKTNGGGMTELQFKGKKFVYNTAASGELELITDTGETVTCTLILMSEWEAKLPEYLAGK